MRPQKLLAILVLIASLFNLGLPGAVATQPTGIQGGSVFVAREFEVRKISRPTLLKQESDPPVIFGKVTDSGGTLQHQNLRSDKEVDDTGGTPQATYSGEHVIFGGTREAIRQGSGAPVATVAGSESTVELKHCHVIIGVGAEHHDITFAAEQTPDKKTQDIVEAEKIGPMFA